MNKTHRIHKPLCEGIINILKEVFNENLLADRVIHASLKHNTKWGSRDRRFVAEHSYQIIRNWRQIKYCGEIDEQRVRSDKDYWKILGTWLLMESLALPDWEQFKGLLSLEHVQELKAKAQSIPKLKESISDWLYEYGTEQLGDRWIGELTALNKEAPVFLRVNETHSTLTDCLKVLQANGIDCEEQDGAIKVLNRRKYTHLPLFRKGKIETQDLGSQAIAKLLAPGSGEFVIDACAGAGGKSLHLADLMRDKGRVLALDINNKKLNELNKRAQRSRFSIIETQKVDSTLVKAYENTADRLLLDVPCSGSGTFRRNVDAKWKLKATFMEEIVKVQANILREYSKMLKPGGTMVYATCSIFPEENQDQVSGFLQDNGSFKLISAKQLWSSEGDWDGFYMALLQKGRLGKE